MLWLVVLLLVAPLAEIYVIVQVAHVIGGWETIALLLIESAIGAWLLKRQGLSTMARISDAISHGRSPNKELVDGLLLLVAGALMLAPGFIGDVIGYLLLFPPTRAPIRALMVKRFAAGRHAGFFAATGPATRFVGTFRAGPTLDVSGRETDRDPPSGELGR